ncbi:MAG: hypothetical protein AAF192_02635 [Pseudomonadota bacterium]
MDLMMGSAIGTSSGAPKMKPSGTRTLSRVAPEEASRADASNASICGKLAAGSNPMEKRVSQVPEVPGAKLGDDRLIGGRELSP